jgi:hypothetical protein
MKGNLQSEIEAGVRQALASLGIVLPSQPASDQDHPSYVAFGSPEHAQFLGLVSVNEGDDTTGFVTYTSQATGKTYRLEDELGVLAHYPSTDPAKAALVVLRQKVNVLESGKPEVPANAPKLWEPVDRYATLVSR